MKIINFEKKNIIPLTNKHKDRKKRQKRFTFKKKLQKSTLMIKIIVKLS